MLSHEEFHKLRLCQFVDPAEVTGLSDWEFMGRDWVGEALGFTEWLRPKSAPEQLGSVALDLDALPADVAEACLSRLGLPLRRHMTLPDLVALYGEPVRVARFVDDRATYEFRIGDPDLYRLSCTVLADGGLHYLVLAVADGAD